MKKNKKITGIIVDDERLARKALLNSLNEIEEDIEIIGEADSIDSALILIEDHKPDIIFLDIQMPGESGFNLLPKLDYNPYIIFVTAYDEFAVKAFEVNALDYLVKPVSTERLSNTLGKIKNNVIHNQTFKKLTVDDMLFLQLNSTYMFIKVEQIIVITSSGDYSMVKINDGKEGLTNKSMNEWESRLPDNIFIRIHRSTIINLKYVVKVEDWFNNSFRVYLLNFEEPFVMSRRYTSLIKSNFN